MTAHFLEAALAQQVSQNTKDVLGQTHSKQKGKGQRLGEEGQNSCREGKRGSLFPVSHVKQLSESSPSPRLSPWKLHNAETDSGKQNSVVTAPAAEDNPAFPRCSRH